MKSKILMFLFLVMVSLFSIINIFAYEGNIDIIGKDEEFSDVTRSNLDLNIKFSTGDQISLTTDSKGDYQVDTNNIFCWDNCNLVPTIKGEYLTIDSKQKIGIEYTTSNYINRFEEYYENIIIDLSSQKYDFKEESQEIDNIPELENSAYYIEYNGTLFMQEPKDLVLSLNAYWIEIKIGENIINFLASNEANQEFVFDLTKEYLNQPFYIKYIFINDGEKPNLKVYDEELNNFTVILKENIILSGGLIRKIKGIEAPEAMAAKISSMIPEPNLPLFSLSMKCSRLKNPSSLDYPILLIHGLHGDEDDYWAYIPDKFSSERFKVYQLQYIPANSDNRYNAFLLKKCIDITKSGTSSLKVNLVSHSMGGLVARTYVAGLGRDNNTNIVHYSEDVNGLVTIGSPLYGSHASNMLVEGDATVRSLYKITALFSAYFWENFSEPAYMDLSVGSASSWNLNEKGLNPSVKYLAIAGITNDIILPNWIFYESDDSDFLVSASSASMRNLGVPLVLLQLNHANEHGKSAVPFNWCNGLLNLCDIEPMVKGISSFLKGNEEEDVRDSFILKDNEYYISSNPEVSDTLPYNEGAVLIKLNTKKPIYKVELKSNFDIGNSHKFFELRNNSQTGLFYHYNYGEVNLIECLKTRYTQLNLSIWDLSVCAYSIAKAVFSGQVDTALLSCINSLNKVRELGINLYGDDFDLCFDNRPIDYGLTLPSGNYSLFVNGINTGKEVEIKSLQTNIYEFDLDLCIINSPKTDSVSSEKRVLFDIEIPKELEKIEYYDSSEKRPVWKSLCNKCRTSYNQEKNFNDGEHKLMVRCTNSKGETEEQEINLFVDSTKPKILRQKPRNREYCTGQFNVTYTEEYLKNVYLYYENNSVVKNDCHSGLNRECGFNVTLKKYENKSIKFHFKVGDLFWNISYRTNYTCLVDTIPPHILTIDTPTNGATYNRYVPFDITLDSEARYLKYKDNLGRNPSRQNSLCSRCDEYGSSSLKRKLFTSGPHNITLIAEDEAGNRETRDVYFSVTG